MFASIWDDVGGRGVGAVIGLLLGTGITFALSQWRRRRERLSVAAGDARDTVVIHLHLVEAVEVFDAQTGAARRAPGTLRIRVLGQGELKSVIPNGHLARVLLHRAFGATAVDPLISMAGIEGSYLLETLTGFVCDRVANGPFDHAEYVLAPGCEPKELARHQPLVINLISRADLALFRDWRDVRETAVEHSGDGARALTLMRMAGRFDAEHARIAAMRKAGKPVTYEETMYLLDLALDRRCCDLPTKPVPWPRYGRVLKELGLE